MYKKKKTQKKKFDLCTACIYFIIINQVSLLGLDRLELLFF